MLKRLYCYATLTMMLPTHALVGVALALPFAVYAPDFAGIALVSGLFGGVFPDLDLYVGHRKTLHYPIYYPVLGAVAIPMSVLVPTALTIAVTVCVVSAAAHSAMDVLGGGLELRPWEATSDRAVYDHLHGRWIAPRRWIRYDGSPEDLLLSVSLAGPLLVVLDGVFSGVVVTAVIVSTVYAALRRSLPGVAELLVEGVVDTPFSDRVLEYVPARYID